MIEALIGLVGVIVGSTITIAKDLWVSRSDKRRDGSYSAIRLICILEEYADACIDVVHDDGTSEGQPAGRTKDGEVYRESQEKLPMPLSFPDDIVWRSIAVKAMHGCLALPSLARSVNRHIAHEREFDGPPDFSNVFAARQKGYAEIALRALKLANDLQREFGIDATVSPGVDPDWNPQAFLEEKILEIDRRRDVREMIA